MANFFNKAFTALTSGKKTPDYQRLDDLRSAGIIVEKGDPRMKVGISPSNMTTIEKQKWDEYVKTQSKD